VIVHDEHGRPEPPLAANEVETLIGFLEYHRATFAWKVSGLATADLQTRVGASTMTLGGMLKHLAYYEDHWFSHRLHGNDRASDGSMSIGTPTLIGNGTRLPLTRPRLCMPYGAMRSLILVTC
jgi:hypothetical protein